MTMMTSSSHPIISSSTTATTTTTTTSSTTSNPNYSILYNIPSLQHSIHLEYLGCDYNRGATATVATTTTTTTSLNHDAAAASSSTTLMGDDIILLRSHGRLYIIKISNQQPSDASVDAAAVICHSLPLPHGSHMVTSSETPAAAAAALETGHFCLDMDRNVLIGLCGMHHKEGNGASLQHAVSAKLMHLPLWDASVHTTTTATLKNTSHHQSNKKRKLQNGASKLIRRQQEMIWSQVSEFTDASATTTTAANQKDSNNVSSNTNANSDAKQSPLTRAQFLSHFNSNEIWYWCDRYLYCGTLNTDNAVDKWNRKQCYNLGENVNHVHLLHVDKESFHPKACTSLFGFEAGALKRRILLVERHGTIELGLLPKASSQEQTASNSTLTPPVQSLQWKTFVDFNDSLHSVYSFSTPIHERDANVPTGLIFVGRKGTVCILWAFPSLDTSHKEQYHQQSLPPTQSFIVRQKFFHLHCSIESVSVLNDNHLVYTRGNGHVYAFSFLSRSETFHELSNRTYYSYEFPQYANVRVLPIARGVRAVCSRKDKPSNSFYFVSRSGKLVRMSLPTAEHLDSMYSERMSSSLLASSMDYSVSQLDKWENTLSRSLLTNEALDARIFEWNCALHIMKGIRDKGNDSFDCFVKGQLNPNSRTTSLQVDITNRSTFSLKGWTIIVLLQRLTSGQEAPPKVKTLCFSMENLSVGQTWTQSCPYSLGDSYYPVQVTLFLAYTHNSKTLGRSGFCTEIFSSALSLLDFVSPVQDSNILSHASIIPDERTLSFRCVRALILEDSFVQQIRAMNQSVQSIQLLVSSSVYHRVCQKIPQQFVTSKNHLVHFRVQKVTGEEVGSSSDADLFQITVQSANQEVLHQIYRSLLGYIVPLQSQLDQSKLSNKQETFQLLHKELNTMQSQLQQLNQRVHDAIYEYKQDEHAFPLEEMQFNSQKFANQTKEIYHALRTKFRDLQIIH